MENTTINKPKYTISTPILTLCSLVLFAGFIDIITSLVGVYYSNLIEVNAINLIVGFPIGVFIWVAYFVVAILYCDIFVFKKAEMAVTKSEKETVEIIRKMPLFITMIAFLIPVHNLLLIIGGGLI